MFEPYQHGKFSNKPQTLLGLLVLRYAFQAIQWRSQHRQNAVMTRVREVIHQDAQCLCQDCDTDRAFDDFVVPTSCDTLCVLTIHYAVVVLK